VIGKSLKALYFEPAFAFDVIMGPEFDHLDVLLVGFISIVLIHGLRQQGLDQLVYEVHGLLVRIEFVHEVEDNVTSALMAQLKCWAFVRKLLGPLPVLALVAVRFRPTEHQQGLVTLADVPVVVADECSSRVDCLSCLHV